MAGSAANGGSAAYTKLFLFGGLVEVENPGESETITRYYTIAGMRVAMHDGSNIYYFATDHLSSTSLVMNASGTVLADQQYYPFGGERTEAGTWLGETDPGYTDLGYTGQRSYAGFDLMDYHARFYSPRLGKFTQPDTLIPNLTDTQSWNRYSYTLNNPVKYIDPTGHMEEYGATGGRYEYDPDPIEEDIEESPGSNPPYLPQSSTPPTLPLPTPGSNSSVLDAQDSTNNPYCDLECLFLFMNGSLELNDLVKALDVPTILRLYKGAWKAGRYAVSVNPLIEGSVAGGSHFVSGLNNPDLTFLQNLGQSGFVGLEAVLIDAAAYAVGLDMAVMGGATGAATPLPIVDETVLAIGGYLTGNIVTTWVLQDIADDINEDLFPLLELGEYNP